MRIWESSNEGSCRQTTTSRREDRRPLTGRELEQFDKEMHDFFKNYKSPIGSESGYPSLILFCPIPPSPLPIVPPLPESP